MTANAVPMESLAQRIAKHQEELETLRQELEARQTHLADLKRRKGELETQLKHIDAQIQAVHQGAGTPSPTVRVATAPKAQPAKRIKPVTRAGKRKPGSSPRLADLLIKMVGMAQSPITVKQMSEEIISKKFPTSSQNIPRMVQTRVQELVTKGVFERVKDQPGVVLAGAIGAKKLSAAKHPTPKASPSGVAKTATRPKMNGHANISLRVLLTDLMSKSQRPLGARELTEQVMAQGYRTKSKNFLAVVRLMLARMENAENVPGKGYRLRKR
jgi:hypothetical protein